MHLDFNDEELSTLAARLHEMLSPLLETKAGSPWMQFKEAVAYSRIPSGTFRRLSAMGLIPRTVGARSSTTGTRSTRRSCLVRRA